MALTPELTPWQMEKWQKQFDRQFFFDEGYIVERAKTPPAAARAAAVRRTPTPRRTRQRGSSTRSTAKSGDSNDSSADPEPERPGLSLNLYDQAALADLLQISKKTLQNRYSVAPHTLPKAIAIPGARGPRWTSQAVQEWLEQRPAHTPKPAPQLAKKKVGRPRIALVGKGGVS